MLPKKHIVNVEIGIRVFDSLLLVDFVIKMMNNTFKLSEFLKENILS